MAAVRVLDRSDIARLVTMKAALVAVRAALAAAGRGEAVLPRPFELHLPGADGELHVKGGYLHGAPVFAVKTATGFYRNAGLGLPVSSGMTLAFDAATGMLHSLILDAGLLTELRTAAAGGIAADLLAVPQARTAAVIGTGGQARYQLRALLEVRPIRRVAVWGRRQEAAERYARDMSRPGLEVSAARTARDALSGADVVITATSSTAPVVQAGWLRPGTHVTAMGSDMPHKQELDPRILGAADKYVPDSIEAAATSGELHHAIEAGIFGADAVYGELTALASGRLPGRTGTGELTVADLTGLGVQDAAIAALAVELADEHGAGRDLPLEQS
jgi:ornithine cyclodeaminase